MWRWLVIGMSVLCIGAQAQNVTIINHYGDTTGLGPDALFYLKGSEEHTVIVNYFEPATSAETRRLEQLVSSATALYLHEMTVIDRGQVRFRKRRSKVLKDLNQIVTDAVQYYQYKELHAFEGFSDEVEALLEAVEELDLSAFDGPADQGLATRENMRRQWVDQQLAEVQATINQEVGLFSEANLLVAEHQVTGTLTAEERAALLREVEAFETHDPLAPLALELSQTSVSLLASKDEFVLPNAPAGTPTEKSNEAFAEQVFALLENNSEQLQDLQADIDALKQAQRISEADKALQAQIDQLRAVVNQLVESRSIDRPGAPEIVPNLPGEVTLQYAPGQTAVTPAGQFVISEVIDLLARNPQLHVMITGYADATGAANTNQRVATQRATAVSQALRQSGIAPERVVVNQFGDSKSTGANPEDRKVVITFIQAP